MNRKILVVSLFLTLVTPGGVLGDSQSLTKCKIRAKKFYLQRAPRASRISGTVLSKSTTEYHLQSPTDLHAQIRLTSASQVKLDIYLLDPPTAVQKRVTEWTGKLDANKEYVLAVNNCSDTKPATFQIVVTPR
jgi:hypothetical protein